MMAKGRSDRQGLAGALLASKDTLTGWKTAGEKTALEACLEIFKHPSNRWARRSAGCRA